MPTEIKASLFDILTAIQEIELFLSGTKEFLDYQADLKTKRAVERNFEIIGEAVNRIKVIDESVHISNYRKIIYTRNRIIHGYDTVSDEIIWSIIANHLPILKKEVESLLNH